MRAHCGSVSASERSPIRRGVAGAAGGDVRPAEELPFELPPSPKLAEAPFAAVRVPASVTHTIGGLLVDKHARVLRADRTPVGGLYAAGATWAASSRAATGGPGGRTRVRPDRGHDCPGGRNVALSRHKPALGELRVGAGAAVARERRGADLRYPQHALVGLDRRPDRGHVALTLLERPTGGRPDEQQMAAVAAVLPCIGAEV